MRGEKKSIRVRESEKRKLLQGFFRGEKIKIYRRSWGKKLLEFLDIEKENYEIEDDGESTTTMMIDLWKSSTNKKIRYYEKNRDKIIMMQAKTKITMRTKMMTILIEADDSIFFPSSYLSSI